MTPGRGQRAWEPVLAGDLALIPLMRGGYALIDAADLPIVRPYFWVMQPGASTRYAIAKIDGQNILMHRLLTGARASELVDHREHNGLDNRRLNIRVATKAQNSQNSYRRASSGFKGVYLHRESGMWAARIQIEGRPISLKYHHRAEDAARAYDAAALEHFGEFALTNAKMGLL